MRQELVLGAPPQGLRRPVLLAGFGGWGDAGSAASIALRHVLGERPPPASAMVDPSACYDFTVARPLTTRREGSGEWMLEYPKLAFHPLSLAGERDALVLVGPEPHFHWPEIAPAMVAYARAAGVQLVLTLGGFVGAVSHRATQLSRRALDPALDARLAGLGLREAEYEGPTAFATALLHAAAAAGLPAASLWVATPPYLQAGNPVAALALLEAARGATGLPLEAEPLKEASEAFLRDVDTALEEHPELAEQLKEMLEAEAEEDAEDADPAAARWKGPDPDRPPPDAPPGLPTGKGLVEAVERYLRQGREDHPGAGPGSGAGQG